MVGGDCLDLAAAQAPPQNLLIGLFPDGGRADVPGRLRVVGSVINAFVQQKILGTGLHIDLLAPLPGVLHLLESLLVGQVDDDHGAVCRLGDPQKAADGLGLQIGRTGFRMTGGTHQPGGLFLSDHTVDDAGVLTVDTADTAQVPQLLQSPIHVPVAHHHGRVGHIHLERGHALAEHLRQLRPDGFVPIVDGHVEAVVAEGAAVCFLMPEIQTVLQALPLVGAGEVDDGGGAALQSRTAAGGEIVRRGGVADVQIKVGVGVNKAGEQETALHIHRPVCRSEDQTAHLPDLFTLHQHVSPLGPPAGDDGTALEQRTHIKHLQIRFCRQYSTVFRKKPEGQWGRADGELTG